MARSVRRDRANKRAIRLVIIVTLVLIAVLMIRIIHVHRENAALLTSEAAVLEELQEEQAKNDALLEKKDRELTVDEIIEIAREKFGLIFKDEILFIPKD